MNTPDPNTLAANVPIEAWQQAAIVVLFCIAFILVIAYILKHTQRSQDKFMQFIEGRDQSWQEFLREQRKCDETRHAETNQILSKLVEALNGHDNFMREAVARIDERSIKPERRTHERGKT